MYKTPLRYPGGKSKAISQIINYIPDPFKEFREPCLGGGSVFFYILQKYPTMFCWINDFNQELYYFWQQVQNNLPRLVEEVRKIKQEKTDGRILFKSLAAKDTSIMTPLDRAVRFFILNRISFSGTIESGGYSDASFKGRFTDSSIERLEALSQCFNNTLITNFDYSTLLQKPGEDVFIFLDPPYLSKTQSRLYGKKGDLHTHFDHARFAKLMSDCPHKWLITYDDCTEVRDYFSFAYIYNWELQYGMNNYKQETAKKGKELFITNYLVR